ncbi:MAG: 30S ribosomal protein S2 [Gammaproteobacteria bacterium]
MNTSIRELMLAGAHFGHRTRFWNPQMADYIYGAYYSTHVINLDRTLVGLKKAAEFAHSVSAESGTVLYVCAKTVAGEVIADQAEKVGMPFVTHRWLGGMLTNFKTTRKSVDRLAKMDSDIAGGALAGMTKKEGIRLLAARGKLAKSIGGVRRMAELPDALFIVDVGWHKGAVREANLLGIPVMAVVDTNHSPAGVDYVIPGNDDSRHAIEIYAREISDAVRRGREERDARVLAEASAASDSPDSGPSL